MKVTLTDGDTSHNIKVSAEGTLFKRMVITIDVNTEEIRVDTYEYDENTDITPTTYRGKIISLEMELEPR